MNTLSTSMDIIDYLQISLIIEKILGRTSLSWTEILAPTWIGIIISVISIIVLCIISIIIHKGKR
mgnify:FL=1